MAFHSPDRYWWKPIDKGERIWIGISIIWCVVLFLVMPLQHLLGKQNSSGEAYRVTPQEYTKSVNEWVAKNKSGELYGTPVVEPKPGTDVYLLAQMWRWYPILKFKKGETYRLHISSSDLQHGFSLQPINMNFQVVPGYDHVLTITPTEVGEFSIVCNEFCGIGHHLMTGKILVVE